MNRKPEVELAAQPLEQADDLGLDADVERRHRLVEHEQVGADGERPGDADALALPAGELVRVAAGGRRAAAARGRAARRTRASSVAAEAVHAQRLGEQLADGHARVERRLRVLEHHLEPAAHAAQVLGPPRPVSSVPSNVTEPASGSTMRSTQRAVVLLPQPDSPTRLSVSPRPTSNDTSDTACDDGLATGAATRHGR